MTLRAPPPAEPAADTGLRDLAMAGGVCFAGAGAAFTTRPVTVPVSIGVTVLPPGPLNAGLILLVLIPVVVVLCAHRRWEVARHLRDSIRDLGHFDALTGLPNRQELNTWTGLRQRAPNALGRPCVLFIDLDRFKHVNDIHGHQVGDQLLMEVADRLRASVRADDTVVRMGGDEFLVLCADVLSTRAAKRVATRITAAVRAPILIGSEQIRISATIGIAMANQPDLDLDHLIHHADRAMYRAKATEPGTVGIAINDDVIAPLVTEAELRRAIDRAELVLHYQPLVRLEDGALTGVEALLRWQHPHHGLLPPGDFVPLLEESGLIVPAGAWVLAEAARQSRAWERRTADRPPLHVSLNVSPRQLNQADFTQMARQAIQRSGARPANLCLEITEGALLRDPAAAWASLRQLKSLGVSLALDDFGTGYSSLSYIRRFNLDILKIDRSFVTGVHESEEDRAIVEHVIGLAHALGMTAVGEGIEEQAQADALRRLGCDAVQGYLYSSPVPAAAIDAMLDGDVPWAAKRLDGDVPWAAELLVALPL
ncbi:MAG: EAL domain-containing protein [Acidimicrobiales bacterium]